MAFNNSINSSKNAVVINLDQVQLEEIVEEKLLHFLSHSPPGIGILKSFYAPAEQALIEFSLEKFKGNQFRTAKFLGINRNTLKKKIVTYKLDIKQLLMKQRELHTPVNRIFLSSISSLNLLSACRAKMALANFQNTISSGNVLKQICHPVERRIIKKVLEHCKGNQIRASKFLGINRNTLKKKISFNTHVRICS